MRSSVVLGTLASCLAACATPASTPPQDPALIPQDPLPVTTGSYRGHYTVPATPDIADAAIYPVDSVEWTVADGVATLHYNLPVGLVGGTIEVRISGPVGPGATSITLTGDTATGTCVAAGTQVTCHEEFGDLGALPISMTVVQDVAARDFAGPVASRVAVAHLFSSDPIGRVDFDLASPAVDDHGGQH